MWKLLHDLYSMVVNWAKSEVYISDIKCENIAIDYDVHSNNLIFRLIDLGGLSDHYNEVLQFTPDYFCNKA